MTGIEYGRTVNDGLQNLFRGNAAIGIDAADRGRTDEDGFVVHFCDFTDCPGICVIKVGVSAENEIKKIKILRLYRSRIKPFPSDEIGAAVFVHVV